MFSRASLFWAVVVFGSCCGGGRIFWEAGNLWMVGGLSGGCREMGNLWMDCGLSEAVFEAGNLRMVCGLFLRRRIG